MIIGVGADLCDIRRIQTSLERFGDRFKMRCFTELERTRSDRKPDAAWSYAKRFAARRPAPRRWEQACGATSTGRIWAW